MHMYVGVAHYKLPYLADHLRWKTFAMSRISCNFAARRQSCIDKAYCTGYFTGNCL